MILTTPDSSPKRILQVIIVLFCVLFAVVWILDSGDFTLSTFRIKFDSSVATGMLVVVVTGFLLYLRLHNSEKIRPWLKEDLANPSSTRLVLVFIALVLVMPLTGLTMLEVHEKQIELETYDDLAAVAELKSRQIENWLSERYGDAMVLAASHGFAEDVEQFKHYHDTLHMEAVVARLSAVKQYHGYHDILLLDIDGKLMLSLREQEGMPSAIGKQQHRYVATQSVQRSDLYRDESGHIHLDWVVPIIVSDANGKRLVATAVLRTSARDFLFPLIQTWPTLSLSAESLLVERDDESVVYLNDLRHRQGSTTQLRLPLSHIELPAVIAIGVNKPGRVAGTDYRGKSVLAAYRPVAGTDWHIIAQIDRDEVFAPLQQLVFWGGIISLIIIMVLGTSILILWRQQRRIQFLIIQNQEYESERKLNIAAVELQRSRDSLQEKENLLADSQASAHIGSWLTEVHTNKVLWSEETFRLFGLAPETAPVPTLDQIPTLLHSDDRTSMQSWVIACLEGSSPPALEIRTCPIDGVDRWLLWQGVLETTPNGEPLRMIGTVQDITGRKLAINRIEYLSRLNNTRSLINATIVHLEEELILFRKVCQFAVEAGKMKMAWIGILNPSSGWVEPIAWHGQGTKYLQDIRISSFGDVPEGHGPTGICVRESHPVFEQNFATSKVTAFWHEQGARYGWGSCASIPLSRGGKVYATFTLYQGDSNAFDPDIKQLLSDIGSDLSFALDSLDIKADREITKQALVDSEAKMATILENVSAYIYLKDSEGRYQYVTPNCLELWGAPMEQVIGATDESFFDATFAKIIHDNDRRVLETGEISRAEETGTTINSGKVVTFLAIKIPLRRPDGSIYGLCGISTDISERIVIEEQLRQQLKELQRWYEVTLDREERVGQLKAEVNTLLALLGEPPHYASQEPLSGVKEQ